MIFPATAGFPEVTLWSVGVVSVMVDCSEIPRDFMASYSNQREKKERT